MKDLLLHYLLRYRWHFFGGLLVQTMATGLAVVPPFLLRNAIDSFSGLSHLGWPLQVYALAIVGVAMLEAVLRFIPRRVIVGASRMVEYDLRNRYFQKLESLEPAYFQQRRIGDLVARATNDLSSVRQLYGPALQNVVNTTLTFLFSLALMYGISVRLSLWVSAVIPAFFGIYLFSRRRIGDRFARVQEQFAAMADHAQETLAGERVVKAYAQEHAEVERFRGVSAEYVQRQLAQVRVTGLMWPMLSLVTGLLLATLLYVGGQEVQAGALTLGELVQFNAYVALLGWPLMALSWVATLWQQGRVGMERITEVLRAEPAIKDGPRTIDGRLRGEVEFRHVSLEIDGRDVLRDLSFTIPAGSTFAIVGALGSGKSTLASLIPRLADPTRGQVLIDGVDVREYRLAHLRRQVGMVPQETFLFGGSIRQNVGFGLDDLDASEARIRQAVRLSRLENDLDQWPNGLETRIGERGVTLSGGQKQRTAIARAVAMDPAILVLDDALSSVDTRTEEAILEGLRGFMAQRTSLVIAHRVSTVRHADQVLVLKGGRSVEQGTHTELVQRNGVYTAMYRRQLIAQELDVEDEEAPPGPAPQEELSRPRLRRSNGSGWGAS